MTALDEPRFWRLPTVVACLGVSETTLWRRVKAGEFPPPVPYGRVRIWPASEVRRMASALIREADPAAATAEILADRTRNSAPSHS